MWPKSTRRGNLLDRKDHSLKALLGGCGMERQAKEAYFSCGQGLCIPEQDWTKKKSDSRKGGCQ